MSDLMPRFWLAFTALTTASLVGFCVGLLLIHGPA